MLTERKRQIRRPGYIDPILPVYLKAQQIALELSKQAAEAQQESWALETQIRNVRRATGPEEKALALQRLEVAIKKYRSV